MPDYYLKKKRTGLSTSEGNEKYEQLFYIKLMFTKEKLLLFLY